MRLLRGVCVVPAVEGHLMSCICLGCDAHCLGTDCTTEKKKRSRLIVRLKCQPGS